MSPTGPVADERQLRLPAAWTGVLDVEFDGRRVWSVEPERHPVRRDGRRHLPWPGQLRPYLTGRTALGVRAHGGTAPLSVTEVAFDAGGQRVSVVDADGRPLAVDKLGRLSPTFDGLGDAFAETLLDEVQALMSDVAEILGVPVYLAYGGLLGAVREGRFIGHDNDVDIAYLSERRHPADLAAENFRLRRGLRGRGWTFHASTATFLQVLRKGAPPERRIDIFASYYVDGVFALDFDVRGKLERDDLLPLGEVVLHGRPLAAPRRPGALLALTYGPGWRVPDPAFRFPQPASTWGRSFGWFGGPYPRHAVAPPPAVESAPGPLDPLEPTPYGEWVASVVEPSTPLVELRFGLGHDSTWLAEQGRRVVAYDIKYNSRTHVGDRPHLATRLTFARLQVDDLRCALAAACSLPPGPWTAVLSGRWRALRPPGRANLWRFADVVLRRGGALTVEVPPQEEHEVLGRTARTGADLLSRSETPGADGTPGAVRLLVGRPGGG